MVRRFFLFAPALGAALLLGLVLLTEGDHYSGWAVTPLSRTVAIACLVGSIVFGLVPRRSDVRLHASVTLAIFAVTAVGQSRMMPVPGVIYRVGAVAFGLLVIATLRAPHRWARAAAAQRPVHTSGRGRSVTVLVVVWAAAALALASQLPRASRAVERRVAQYFGAFAIDTDEVGFSSTLQLGSTRGMMQSSRVVMRIEGEQVDYLRGAVLDDYDARHQRWTSRHDATREPLEADTPAERTSTRILVASTARVAHGAQARWFLPAGACELRSESGHVTVDASGVAHPDPPNLANEISFRSGKSCAPGAGVRPPVPPKDVDLAIPPKLRAALEPTALAWTRDLGSDREKLDAMARELGRFGYSLDVQRSPKVDAVVDLLTIHREGHCELFASAMALLGRTRGIPTRVVAGYRVNEVNVVTGRAVVRERNAHTWVEAWVEGRWQRWDPTPVIEMTTRSQSSSWEQLTEVAAWVWDHFVTLFWRIGLARLGFGGAAVVAALLVLRRFMQRDGTGDGGTHAAASRPLPAFESLTSALERAGWIRTASEPLERFAERVVEGGEPWSSDVAEALVRYAELRYGGIGEERSVAKRLDALATQIRPRP